MALFTASRRRPPRASSRRERRALLLLREDRLRDLGGLTLEMYRRDHFNEALVVERCAELVAIEARVQRDRRARLGRRACGAGSGAICACGAPILIGARYCPSCGRSLDDDGANGEDTDA